MLRHVRLDDLIEIAALECELFAEMAYSYSGLRQLFDLHGVHWVVAEVDDVICGYALVGLDYRRRGWVMSLGVTPAYRRRGIGRTLLERAVEHCRIAHAERVRLTVRPGHATARNLYKDVGFTWISEEDHYFGADEPRQVLERRFDHEPKQWGGATPDDPRWIKRSSGSAP
ncbi:GNAT family N-acetyltransferase [Nocardia sp. NBC_01377]|uniref:GNAT family N-acetyltransferase n=1 Tax=Nocardia sp. NBC_01377 TaxID=2903595 RepID=UPI003250967E